MEFEYFEGNYYIVEKFLSGELCYGRILNQGAENYYVVFEDSNDKVPIHGLDFAKNYARKHYKEHEPY